MICLKVKVLLISRVVRYQLRFSYLSFHRDILFRDTRSNDSRSNDARFMHKLGLSLHDSCISYVFLLHDSWISYILQKRYTVIPLPIINSLIFLFSFSQKIIAKS